MQILIISLALILLSVGPAKAGETINLVGAIVCVNDNSLTDSLFAGTIKGTIVVP